MKLFIGSSKEAEQIANLIKRILSHLGHEATIWTGAGVFIPSLSTIVNLEQMSTKYDAALFVYSEDDVTTSRKVKTKSVRDNVIFEAGLFVGKMGHEKVALCVYGNPKIPTDQSGVTKIQIHPTDTETEIELNTWLNNINSTQVSTNYNVTMCPRKLVDHNDTLEERWKYAQEITFVNYASTAFTSAQKVVPNHVADKFLRQLYLKKLKNGCNFKFLLTEPNTFADFDASFSKMNVVTNLDIEISRIIQFGVTTLEHDVQAWKKNTSCKKGTLEFKTTAIALPYSLMRVINDRKHANLNYIKVDLYSPFLTDDSSRRSFILTPDNVNYQFFQDQISDFWNKGEKNVKPQTKIQSMTSHEINTAMHGSNYQYLVGNANGTNTPALFYDKKVEIKLLHFENAVVDHPHYHLYSSEYLYILQGECTLRTKTKKGWDCKKMHSGDFCTIPKLTIHEFEFIENTRMLCIKTPSLNDTDRVTYTFDKDEV